MKPERSNSTQLAEATIREWTWKTDAMKRMTIQVCRLALDRSGGHSGTEFSANDLPEFDHAGVGIAGSVFRRLIADGILSRVGVFDGAAFLPKIVYNAGGNRIGVYRLASGTLARKLLEIHDQPHAHFQQMELQT